MAPSSEQQYAAMSENDLLFQQLIEQASLESLDNDTTGAASTRRAELERNLRHIDERLTKVRNGHQNGHQNGSYYAASTTTPGKGASPRSGKPTASSMSSTGMNPWKSIPMGLPGGSGPKKRTFDTNVGRRSPPRPSKYHRPTPSPRSTPFSTPSRDDRSWNGLGSSPSSIIDLTNDTESLNEHRAEEEKFAEKKQQEEADAELARRLQNELGESFTPHSEPSYMPDPQGSYDPIGSNWQFNPERSSSSRPDMNSFSSFQPGAPNTAGTSTSAIPALMPGSFDDGIDDIFGDRYLEGYAPFVNSTSQPMADTSSPYQTYSARTSNSGFSPALSANEVARQAALRRQQQQFAEPEMSYDGSNTLPTPASGYESPFMPASQMFNGQASQRPGSLMGGSANPLNYAGPSYQNPYSQSSSGARLSDVINRTSGYDYVNGTDEFGNPLDQRVLDVANDGENTPSEEEGIRRLLADISNHEDTLGADEEPDPEGLVFPLYKHQRQALRWMTRKEQDPHKKGGILADDMGLGKTLSSLALMISRRPKAPEGKTHVKTKTTLIIAPLALIEQWRREIATKLRPKHRLSVFKYHASKAQYEDLRGHDVVITTYGTVASEMGKMETYMKDLDKPRDSTTLSQKFPLLGPRSLWYRIIVDEAQCIKNAKTKTAKAVHQLKSEYRWCLTGTPMMNNVSELASLLTFLRIEPYCAPEKFQRTFGCLSAHRAGGYIRNDSMKKLQVLLKATMLRRTKDSTIDGKPIINLPPKIEENVHVVFDQDEASFYKDLEGQSQVQFSRYLKNGAVGKKYTVILTLLLRLRQACCHPHLHLTDLDYIGSTEVGEDEMIELAKTMKPDVIGRLKETDSFECPICYDAVANPLIILPCGHETCSECFSRLTDGSQQRDVQDGQENAKTLCPQCRGPVDTKKTITYDIFKQVYLPDKAKTEDLGDRYETDSSCDSEFDDEGFARDDDEVDKNGNLKDFIVPDSEDGDLDNSDIDLDVRMASRKKKPKVETDEEFGDLEDIRVLVQRNKQLNSGGKGNIKKPKKVRSKGKKKEAEIKPHMLKKLRKDAGKNKKAHKKYMHYLKEIWEPSAKVTKCKELITSIQSTGEKTIVFSQWTLLLDLLEIPLKHELGVKYRRYDGSMSAAMRVNAANDFMDDPDVKVILVSLKAGNAGLNLNSASQVIIMDPFWNPYIERQAVDRAHRIGQQNTVHVHRILIKDTVEDRIVKLQEEKRKIIENALSNDAIQNTAGLNMENFAYLFGIRDSAM